MTTCLHRNWFLQFFSLVILFPAIMPVSGSYAGNDYPHGPAGPSFTNPSHVQEMPESWKNAPVTYDPQDSDADIVVTLDSQLYYAWEPLIREYAEKQGLNIITAHGACGLSAGRLLNKAVDIGAFCCPPDTTDRLPGLEFHTLGIAAIALLVHPDNPVNTLTLQQARQIFSGKTYRWTDLMPSESNDSTASLIQPVGRLHCKLRPGHWRQLLDNEDLFSPSLIEVGAIPDMISQVALNPRAIGYEITWMARYYQDRGKVKILKINGYSPEDHSDLISAHYPLYRTYSLTTWEGENTANPGARKLVEYILKKSEHLDSRFNFVHASRLRQAGWKFRGNELVGEP